VTQLANFGISRRQLFRGDLRGPRPALRPPWASSEQTFVARCDRCRDCVSACPEQVIRLGTAGFPEMEFSARGCSLCGECVTACGGKALRGDPASDMPWDLVAEIGDGCLARRGVVCRSCGESCGEGAIRFRLRVGGVAEPLLVQDACTGCGWCVGVCPTHAVRVIASSRRREPASPMEQLSV
jgi:ferredoxin-type protein NapF